MCWFITRKVVFVFALTLFTCGYTTVFAEGEYKPRPLLDHYADNRLQSSLRSVIRNDPKVQKLIDRKKLALCVVDLHSETPKYAQFNGNVMLYAASLPKIGILLAAYESFEDGSLKETRQIQEDLTSMIRVSSNDAATRMIDLIGMRRINSILAAPKYALYDPSKGGGLWVGKRYAREGRRYPDPINHISHGATAAQTCRFYFLLVNQQMINPKRSKQILENLSKPALYHKFMHPLAQLSPEADVYRKSGTWRSWHADSVLVQDKTWRNYILVGLVESAEGESILRNLLPMIEQVLHPATKPVHKKTGLISYTPQFGHKDKKG